MKSIQTKFVVLIVVGLSFLAVWVSGFSIAVVNKVTREDSETMMNETCQRQALQLDSELKMVEQAVTTIYGYAQRQLDTYDSLEDESDRERYSEDIRVLAVDVSNYTEGAMAVYFRYNPELTGNGTEGFFWSRGSSEEEFKREESTDILAYDPEDEEHVGWYYIPVQSGKATWMEPYYNKNINVEMISYVIPFYQGTQLIGVIGMDVDFSVFIDIAQDVELYDTGGGEVACLGNRTLYYREEGDGETVVRQTEIADRLFNELNSKEATESLSEYNFGGQKYMIAFQTLSNEMKIMVYAPVSEINAQRNQLILVCAVLTVFMLGMMIFLTVYITRRIVHPLQELTEAAERFVESGWDISITCHTKDEVKRLTDSIVKMARETRSYIKEINRMAYQDGLTGVKNKACYIDYVEELIAREDYDKLEYALVILDVNRLKWVNDTYGHEAGDSLIMAASRQISDIFSHSPVFRLGGDEFAVIMTEADYERRDELLLKFRKSVENKILDSEKNIVLSVACGMAVYPADGKEYGDVFKTADDRMYENKASMKKGEAPR